MVIDASTEIPAAAFRPSELASGLGGAIVARAGFGRTLADQSSYVVLIDLNRMEAQSDPYRWSDWTMRAAHLWLAEHLEEHPHGGALDVEAMRLAIVGAA